MSRTQTNQKTVLITGAGGYIGSVLVPQLLSDGYHIIAIDRFFFGEQTLPEHQNLKLIKEDTRNLQPDILHNVYAVIDLAALSNDPSGEYFFEATSRINHEARVRTANLAKKMGAERYIFPSSCSVYGNSSKVLSENSPVNPLTHYAEANLAAEKEILELSGPDFSVTILRLATVFGYSPRMRFDLAINNMIHTGWAQNKINVMRNGDQYRPFLHIEDAVSAFQIVLETPSSNINSEIFNIGSEKQTFQLGPLAQYIRSFLVSYTQSEILLNWYGDPDNRSYQVDFSKFTSRTSWKSKESIEGTCDDIFTRLESSTLVKTTQTLTLEWYKALESKQPGILTKVPKINPDKIL